jgi:peptidoglycan/LPS O-acetylase OafA/YrhL
MSAETAHGGRVASLEGLRGVAAFTVVLRHTFNAVALPLGFREALLQSPLALLLNGQGAVQLFFVLSGYVLAGSVERGTGGVGLVQFYVKRILRIHPPFVLALLLTWCAAFLYAGRPAGLPASPWLGEFSAIHLSPGELLSSLRFPGTALGQLPVGWTLYVEMIFSLLLPALVLVARRLHWSVLVVASVYALVQGSDQLVLRYALDFCLGIAAYLERDRLAGWIRQVGRPWQAALVVAAALLFSSPLLLGWSRPAFGILVDGIDWASIGLMALGSVTLVVFAVHVPLLNRCLSVRPVVFLGKISYSLYLLHFMVLIAASRWVADPALLLLAVSTGSVLLSAAFHPLVERPSILAANALCKWLARRAGARPLESNLPGR